MKFFSSSKNDNNPKISAKANIIIHNLKNTKYYDYCMKGCMEIHLDELTNEEKICLMQCSDNVHNYLASNYAELIKLKGTI